MRPHKPEFALSTSSGSSRKQSNRPKCQPHQTATTKRPEIPKIALDNLKLPRTDTAPQKVRSASVQPQISERTQEEDNFEKEQKNRRKLKKQYIALNTPAILEEQLLLEYSVLIKQLPSGITVAPRPSSPLVWDGAIFVRQGPFKHTTFKFKVTFPLHYPLKTPSLRFLTIPNHPLIDKKSGEMMVDRKLVERGNSDFIYTIHLLVFMKRILLRPYEWISQIYEEPSHERGRAIIVAFEEEAQMKSDLANQKVFENEAQSLLKVGASDKQFDRFDITQQQIKKQLQSETGISEEMRIQSFKSWFVECFVSTVREGIN